MVTESQLPNLDPEAIASKSSLREGDQELLRGGEGAGPVPVQQQELGCPLTVAFPETQGPPSNPPPITALRVPHPAAAEGASGRVTHRWHSGQRPAPTAGG